MMRPFRAMLAILVLGAAVGAAPPSQNPSQTQQPVFRSGVDLVTVDVLVLDKAGRPIPELTAEDFSVTVDGKPRRIASVEYMSHFDRFATAPDRTQIPNLRQDDRVMMRAEYSSNTKSAPGRLFVLVIDSGNMTRGGGRGAMEAAGQFVQKLAPNDLVAVVSLPAGVTVDFTADRLAIKNALIKIVGGGALRYLSNTNVSLGEAFSLVTGSQKRLWDEAVRMECNWARSDSEYQNCRSTLEADARNKFQAARISAESSERAFEILIRRLSRHRRPEAPDLHRRSPRHRKFVRVPRRGRRSEVAGRPRPGRSRQPLRPAPRPRIPRGVRRQGALPVSHAVRGRAAAERRPRRDRRPGWRGLLQPHHGPGPHLRADRA